MKRADATSAPVGVLFVCLGNICRSPLAEGVFRHQVRAAGLEDRFLIDSAGTGAWHVGQPPDSRMRQTARTHGIDLDGQQARQFAPEDLERFDHILVMDKDNLHDVLYHDRDGLFGHRVRLLREFDPEPGDFQVPDPYYGGSRGFEEVFAIVSRATHVLLHRLVHEYDLDEVA